MLLVLPTFNCGISLIVGSFDMDVASLVGSVRRACLPRSGHSLAGATRCGNLVRLAQTVTSIYEILAVGERWQPKDGGLEGLLVFPLKRN